MNNKMDQIRSLPADKIFQYRTFTSTLASNNSNLWQVEVQRNAKRCKSILKLVHQRDQLFHPRVTVHLAGKGCETWWTHNTDCMGQFKVGLSVQFQLDCWTIQRDTKSSRFLHRKLLGPSYASTTGRWNPLLVPEVRVLISYVTMALISVTSRGEMLLKYFTTDHLPALQFMNCAL